MNSVEDSYTGHTWAYTVGLAENFDQPDLLMVDGSLAHQCLVVNHLAQLSVATREGRKQAISDMGLKLKSRAATTKRELIAGWIDRYGRFPDRGELVEVKLPKGIAKRRALARMERAIDEAA